MQTVGLTDELEICLSSKRPGVRLACPDSLLSPDSTNLVFRAAESVLQRSHSSVGVDLILRKHIPTGAGLGGGSSDAAATIAGLNHLLQLGWTASEMTDIGRGLGSDVPFFFHAPSVIVRGCGENLLPITLQGERWIVLVNPGFPISTQEAYGLLDRKRRKANGFSNPLEHFDLRGEFEWEEVLPLMANDFEQVLLDDYPALGDLRSRLLQAGAEAALVSGSGSTVFGVFQSEPEALRARSLMEAVPGWQAWAVSTKTPALLSAARPGRPSF